MLGKRRNINVAAPSGSGLCTAWDGTDSAVGRKQPAGSISREHSVLSSGKRQVGVLCLGA